MYVILSECQYSHQFIFCILTHLLGALKLSCTLNFCLAASGIICLRVLSWIIFRRFIDKKFVDSCLIDHVCFAKWFLKSSHFSGASQLATVTSAACSKACLGFVGDPRLLAAMGERYFFADLVIGWVWSLLKDCSVGWRLIFWRPVSIFDYYTGFHTVIPFHLLDALYCLRSRSSRRIGHRLRNKWHC